MKTTVTIHCDCCNKFRNLQTDGTADGYDAAKRAHIDECSQPSVTECVDCGEESAPDDQLCKPCRRALLG